MRGLSFSLAALRISAVRSFHHSQSFILSRPQAILRDRESLLSNVLCLAQPWVLVHANDARNRGNIDRGGTRSPPCIVWLGRSHTNGAWVLGVEGTQL